jgi:hypothetical protein
VINGLVDKRNTVIVSEHYLDVAANPDSYTGHFPAEALGVARPT